MASQTFFQTSPPGKGGWASTRANVSTSVSRSIGFLRYARAPSDRAISGSLSTEQTATGQIRSSSTDDIACWFIDTNYNGESFFVRHAYFTGADEPYEKLKRALRAEIDEAAWSALNSTKSYPFDKPKTGKIAIKVMGRSTSSEIMQPDYRFLDQDLKLSTTRLSKGELLVQHAVFRQPVKVVFPKPAYKQD